MTSPKRTPCQSMYNIETDTVTFENSPVRERSIVSSAPSFQERPKTKIKRCDHNQKSNAFFMPRCSSMSRACKYGNFSRVRKQ